jgi:two-component system, chemotaxis family, chemotaxis protein CheY
MRKRRQMDGVPLVLVVEDDTEVSDALGLALELFDIRVRSAENGLAAMRLLQEGLRPTVILLDLMMPIMDGQEFRRLQLADAALREIPVVVLTAQSVSDGVKAAMNPRGWLTKPVGIEDLVSAVGQAAGTGAIRSG